MRLFVLLTVTTFLNLIVRGSALLPFEDDGKFGLKSASGVVIVEANYDDIDGNDACWESIGFRVKKGQKYGFLDEQGKVLIPLIFQNTGTCWEFDLIPVKQNGKWGFINKRGKQVVDFKYDDAFDFENGIASVALIKNNIKEWGGICLTGQEVIPVKYNEPFHFKENTSWAMLGKKIGLITPAGKIVIPFIYDEVSEFYYNRALVKRNGFCGIIDKMGHPITPLVYSNYTGSIGASGDLLAMEQNGKWGFVNYKTGQAKGDFRYEKALDFDHQDKCWTVKDGKYGMINRKGRVLVPFDYDTASHFVNHRAVVQKNGKFGVINSKGKQIVDVIYDNWSGRLNAPNQLCLFQKNGMWGFVNIHTGKAITEFMYDGPIDFTFSDSSWAKLNNKYGYLTSSGQVVVPFKYDNASHFSKQRALVFLNGKFGVVDNQGNEIVPCLYTEWGGDFMKNPTMALFKYHNKWGYVNLKTGQSVTPFVYDKAAPFDNGMAEVYKGEAAYRVDESGIEVKQ